MRTSSVKLFCLPCAGASATMYRRWQRVLPPWIKVVPVELPGHGMRLGELCVEDFQTLVGLLCDDIAPQVSGRPWAVFGHSMGALLGFGVVARLQSSKPAVLFAAASSAPSRRNPERIPDTNDDAALIADLRRQGGTPQEVFASAELLSLTLDTLRADYRVCQSFEYCRNEPLATPVRIFAGRHDDIESSSIEAWRNEAGGSFTLHWFDGGHFFIREQEVQVLAMVERNLRELCEPRKRSWITKDYASS